MQKTTLGYLIYVVLGVAGKDESLEIRVECIPWVFIRLPLCELSNSRSRFPGLPRFDVFGDSDEYQSTKCQRYIVYGQGVNERERTGLEWLRGAIKSLLR